MACYHPLKGFPVGITDLGKTKYKIVSQATEFVTSDTGEIIYDSIDIPCGKCIGCRLSYSREWANRMMLEATYHEESWFVTLTYDNKHLPTNEYYHEVEFLDENTGELFIEEVCEQSPIHTLVKNDVQLFMKRLRKNSGQELRFYGSGEYGDQNFRPHYHIIVFGLKLNDLYGVEKTKTGGEQYCSHLLEKCWKKGRIRASPVTWDTCAYVARYVTKKLKGPKGNAIYNYFNIQPPFSLMSNRPGIGKKYFEDNADYFYKYDKIALETKQRGYVFKPPRYYDNLYDVIEPEKLSDIKFKRRIAAEAAMALKLENYQSSERFLGFQKEEILAIEEQDLLTRLGMILERKCEYET